MYLLYWTVRLRNNHPAPESCDVKDVIYLKNKENFDVLTRPLVGKFLKFYLYFSAWLGFERRCTPPLRDFAPSLIIHAPWEGSSDGSYLHINKDKCILCDKCIAHSNIPCHGGWITDNYTSPKVFQTLPTFTPKSGLFSRKFSGISFTLQFYRHHLHQPCEILLIQFTKITKKTHT